jgi:hypothetical protein
MAAAISERQLKQNSRVFRPAHQNFTANPAFNEASARLCSSRLRSRLLLLNRPLQIQRPWRQLRPLRLQQIRIEPAAVVDALDRVGGDAQADVAAEGFGHEGDIAQIGQEPALGLDVGVAHRVAHLGALGRQFAAPRHRINPLTRPQSRSLEGAAGVEILILSGTADV